MDSNATVYTGVGLFTAELGMTVAQAEQSLILTTLEKMEQNRTKAARVLGISIRTLRNKLRSYRVQAESNGQ